MHSHNAELVQMSPVAFQIAWSVPCTPPPTPPSTLPSPRPPHLLHPALCHFETARLSTCWSGEAHLWAYLAPPESSKHSFLWLSVWWRQAAMWNTAQHQQAFPAVEIEQASRLREPLSSSQGTLALLLKLPHIDLEVVFCVIHRFSLLFESTWLHMLGSSGEKNCCTLFSVFLMLLLFKMTMHVVNKNDCRYSATIKKNSMSFKQFNNIVFKLLSLITF